MPPQHVAWVTQTQRDSLCYLRSAIWWLAPDGDIDSDMEGLTEAEEEAHQDYLIAVDKWNLLSVHTALHKKRPRWYCEFCLPGTPVRQEQALQRTASGDDTSSNEAAVGTELLQDAVAADSLEGSAVDCHALSVA